MCGIACHLDKLYDDRAAVGSTIVEMLNSLDLRGPDSAGVALYSPRTGAMTLRVKVAIGTATCLSVIAGLTNGRWNSIPSKPKESSSLSRSMRPSFVPMARLRG